jgi:hypothetical protein
MEQLSSIECNYIRNRTTICTNLSIYLVFGLFGINYGIFPKFFQSWNFQILAFLGILSVLLRE